MSELKTQNSKLKTLFVVGPTASGKSALAMRIAQEFDGEIICADSQTIKREMNIGTAKPSAKDQTLVPHHMLDVVELYDPYTVVDFQKNTRDIIYDIHKRNKLPIVVGGTGLYVDSVYYQYEFSAAVTSEHARSELETMSADELLAIIVSKGYEIPSNSLNPRHLIRTVERQGSQGQRGEPLPEAVIIGINPSREVLVDRINKRVDVMFGVGLIEELKGILAKHGRPPRSFDAIGYRIILRYLEGEINETEAKELFKTADRQYAKRQVTWFKRNPDIKWFESTEQAWEYVKSSRILRV